MTACRACVGGYLGLSLLDGCSSTKMVNGSIQDSDLIVPLSEFGGAEGNQGQYGESVIVRNAALKFPLYVYRTGGDTFIALWMRCTHQGTELQVFGQRLECPAHGSQFDIGGVVLRGPADTNLKSFPVRIDNNQLKISLR